MTIIRRRHTSNYSTLPNSVFNDQRLALDEKGALGWFLTRPHDWEVNKAGCARLWGIGRDKVNRIFRALIASGWARRETLRAEDGTILGVRFVICDEPGAEMGEAEAEHVLAAERDDEPASDGEMPGEVTADAPLDPGGNIVVDAAGNRVCVASQQQTEKASEDAGYPSTEKASTVLSNERILKTPPLSPPSESVPMALPKAVRGEQAEGAVPEFERMRSAWPEPILSRQACERLWARLSDKAKHSAVAAAGRYVADTQAKGRKLCDLATYLREARWERFDVRAAPGPVMIRPGSPQFWRWREYRMQTIAPGTICDRRGRPFTVQQMDQCATDNRSICVPSEWPPAKGAQEAAGATRATGPPSDDGNAGVAPGGEGAALQAKLEADAEQAAREFIEAEGSGR